MRNAIFLAVLVLVGCGRAIQPQAGVNPPQADSGSNSQAQTQPTVAQLPSGATATMTVRVSWRYMNAYQILMVCEENMKLYDYDLVKLIQDSGQCQVSTNLAGDVRIECDGSAPTGAAVDGTCVWQPSYAL